MTYTVCIDDDLDAHRRVQRRSRGGTASRTFPAAVALMACVTGGAWLLAERPAAWLDGVIAEAGSPSHAVAPKAAFDPRYLVPLGIRAPSLAESAPLAATWQSAEARPAALPPPVALAPEAAPTIIPLPPAPIATLDAGVPLPMPRPPELRAATHDAAPLVTRPGPTRVRAAAAPLAPAPVDNRGFFEKLFGAPQPSGPVLAYAAPETAALGGAQRAIASAVTPYDRYTAVYDIAAHTVYMPDGSRLEAHSGLGDKLDDPGAVHVRMRGPTPPHLYDLTAREQLFHGVRALRLNPVGGGSIFGRTGLLAHTYMLGPNGDSNGCVSFRDYNAFLQAFLSGDVRRLAVVTRRG